MRRCCCSTMRCRRSMRTPRSAYSRRCGRRGAGAASSSSATGCRRCRTRTRSWCCATAASPSAATTPRCSPPAVGTRPSGGCNSSRRRLSAADEAGDGPGVRGAALALLRRAAAPDRAVLARAFFWLVVAAGLDAAGPVLGKSFLDRHVVPHAGPIWAIAGLLGGAWAAGSLASVLRYGQLVQLSGVAMRSVQRLRDRVYGHVLGLPMAFFDRAIVGQLVSRITNDTEQVKTLYVQALFVTLDSVVVLGAMIATMAWLNWRLMLIVATLAPAVAAIVWAYQRLSAPAVTRSRALRSDINAQAAETIAGVAVVQAAGAAQRFSQRFAATNEAHYAARRGELRANAWLLRPALDLLDVAILAAVIAVYGARHDHAGALGPLEVGVLYAFVSWIARIVEPLTQITMQFSQLQQAMVAAARVNALLEQAQAPRPRGSAVVGAGRIELDRLSFGYIAGMPVLRELSLTIEPGRFVGIVGATGSGKSTLLALLLRFYAADRGTLRIDGRPIEEYADEGLHDRIAFVPQEPFLLAASVRDNIAMGRPLSAVEVEAAARAAHAHEFVARLAQGYDTDLGERGARLSAGEKQLIAIARAIAAAPRILLLDEATAAIDSETEARVQRTLAGLRGRVTVVAVAHRLSTVRDADAIVVLHHGRIAEQGSPDELMAIDGGLYRRLVLLQQLAQQGDDD